MNYDLKNNFINTYLVAHTDISKDQTLQERLLQI
jgi:hypothetical protein